jgi:hypothetical protein
VITRHRVSDIVRQRAPSLFGRIAWGSNEAVHVTAPRQTVGLSQGVDRAVLWLLNQSADPARGGFAQLTPLRDVEVPLGSTDVRPSVSESRWTPGHVEIPIVVYVDGVEAARTHARFVLVRASRDSASVATTGSHAGRFNPPVDRTEPVSPTAQTPVLVQRNDRVKLLLEQGAVRVEAQGIALTAGTRGGRITVAMAGDRRTMTGHVVDRGIVAVTENP